MEDNSLLPNEKFPVQFVWTQNHEDEKVKSTQKKYILASNHMFEIFVKRHS